MIKFLKKLWRDRRDNALVIAGAALPLVVGAAGLATDTIQWTLWKRELQRAADSAAYAGVYVKAQSGTTTDIQNAVCAHLNTVSNSTCSTASTSSNNHTGYSLLSGYPAITYPADDTANSLTNQVQVVLRMQHRLGFSSLFLTTTPTIQVTARAAMMPGLNPCAIGLSTTDPSVIIGGSSTTNLGCPVMSDSTACPAVTTNGNSYNFVSPTVAAAGCLPSSITGVTTLLGHYLQQPDPFAGKYSTDIPAGMTCKNQNQMTYTTSTGTGQNKVTYNHLKAGCYSGQNAFKLTGTYYLDPGVYYLDSADFDTTGGANLYAKQSPDNGTAKVGVTFVLTGTTPGSIKLNGNSVSQLYAPTASNCGNVSEGGTTVNSCNYQNMLFIQASNATLNNNNNITGDASSMFDGALYLPKGQVTFSGSSGATTKCAMVIGWTLQFTGNTNLQNDTSGCTANTTATIQQIRLVA
jgi:Flp pilus assembly protein TadG